MPGGRSGSSANGGWREERVFDCEGKLIKQRGLFCHSERSEESSPGRPGRFLSATIPACQDGGAKMVPHSQMASQ